MNLVAPDEHQLLVFWVQLAVLLLTARSLGLGMRRLGQPAVIGELLAGVVLGPSLLGRVAPGLEGWLFPADDVQSGMLFTVGWIGVTFLLVSAGFETDLSLIRRLGRGAALVSVGSLVAPLVLGGAVGLALPAELTGEAGDRVVVAAFLATALSISSLPVIAKILREMGLMRRNFGQMILAAGTANDLVGWILLGIVAGLAQAGGIAVGHLALTLGGMAVFLAAALTVGQRAVDALLRQVRRYEAGATGAFTAVILVALFSGALTQYLGVEAVLGAFVAGIALGRSRFKKEEVEHQLEIVTAGVFAPVFFATAGLRVDLGLLAQPQVLFWTVVVLVVASLSKFLGAWAGAKAARLPGREGLALGVGLNARGALEIVIATVGVSLGVLNQASYTVIVVMAIATSTMAGPMLRSVIRSWHGTHEERQRLQREESMSRNVIVRPDRLLLPSRGGPNSIVAAQVLHLAWPQESAATVLSVGADPDQTGIRAVVDVFGDRRVQVERIGAEDASDAILGEAGLGYGAIGVGAPEASGGPWILSPIVDELMGATSIPLVIVRRARNLERLLPQAFARALVPVSANASSRAAQEIACNLSAHIGTEVVLTHVVNRGGPSARTGRVRQLLGLRAPGEPWGPEGGSGVATLDPGTDVADKVMAQAQALAAELGARVRPAVRAGTATADEIVAAAAELDVDLVVVGANLRRLEGRPFLGHLVEQVLDDCPATVVVVATPTGPHG